MQKIYICGIGGEGLSWIAKILIERGYVVYGSDLKHNSHIQDLLKMGLQKFQEGDPDLEIVKQCDLFLYTSALLSSEKGNEIVSNIKKLGIPTYDRNSFFKILLEKNKVIACAGTHGKTTTSSMLAYLLDGLGVDCGFGIGGISMNFETNSRNGNSDIFVIEADEFGDAFLGLNPYISIITNLEMDHHDYFENFQEYCNSFKKFIHNTENCVVVCGDDQDLLDIVKESGKKYLSYGEGSNNDAQIIDLRVEELKTSFEFINKGHSYKGVVNFPGKHYVLNAISCLLVCDLLGFDINAAIKLLIEYKGTKRRFQSKSVRGVTFVNDYGHHPTEIKVTIEAAIKTGKRVLVVYEPHQYRRCYELKDSFRGIFQNTYYLFQTQIYASRENKPYPITNDDFFKITSMNCKSSKLIQWEDTASDVLSIVKKGDLVLIFAVGHGDVIFNNLIKTYEIS